MTITELSQLGTLLVLIYNCYRSWRNGQKIEEVHHATNSMKDELVAAAHKAGKAEEREQETNRKKTRKRKIK